MKKTIFGKIIAIILAILSLVTVFTASASAVNYQDVSKYLKIISKNPYTLTNDDLRGNNRNAYQQAYKTDGIGGYSSGELNGYIQFMQKEYASGKPAYDLFKIFNDTKEKIDNVKSSYGILQKLWMLVTGQWKKTVKNRVLQIMNSKVEDYCGSWVNGYYKQTLSEIEAEGLFKDAIDCLYNLI